MDHQNCKTVAAPTRRAAVAWRCHIQPEVVMMVMIPVHSSDGLGGQVRRHALRRCHSCGRARGGRPAGGFEDSASVVMSCRNRPIPSGPGQVSSGLIRLSPTYGNVPSRQTARGLAHQSRRGPGGTGGRVRRQTRPRAEPVPAAVTGSRESHSTVPDRMADQGESSPVKPGQTNRVRPEGLAEPDVVPKTTAGPGSGP